MKPLTTLLPTLALVLAPLALARADGAPTFATAQGRVYELKTYSDATLASFDRPLPCPITPLPFVPSSADHRPGLSPVKDQGRRGTCTAHAVMAALEAWPGVPDDLSEQDAHCLFRAYEREHGTPAARVGVDKGVSLLQAVVALAQNRVCDEATCSYETDPTALGPDDEVRSGEALAGARWGVRTYVLLNTALVTSDALLTTLLSMDRNVLVDLEVAWNEKAVHRTGGTVDVVVDDAGVPVRSGLFHAMLICGYDTATRRFIVRNSWGTDWGDGGYCHMSFDYLRAYARSGAVVLSPATEGMDLLARAVREADALAFDLSVRLLGR